jgi:hypothetical protein
MDRLTPRAPSFQASWVADGFPNAIRTLRKATGRAYGQRRDNRLVVVLLLLEVYAVGSPRDGREQETRRETRATMANARGSAQVAGWRSEESDTGRASTARAETAM